MKNTIARKGNKTAAKASTATVKPFTVTTVKEWVEIETTVRADHMAYLEKQAPYIVQGYGRDIVGFMRRGLVTLLTPLGREAPKGKKSVLVSEAMGFPAIIDEDVSGYKMTRSSLKMEKSDWDDLNIVAAFLDCDPVTIIRAGVADRVESLKAFNRSKVGREIARSDKRDLHAGGRA